MRKSNKLLVSILLIILLLTSYSSVQGHGVSNCIDGVEKVRFITANLRHSQWIDTEHFIRMEGENVDWLGYAPRKIPDYWLLERQGEVYGFKGVNLDKIVPVGIFYTKDKDGNTNGRFTLSYYPPSRKYIVMQTTLARYSHVDGTAYDYHGVDNCMWWIDKLYIENYLEIKENL